MSATFTLGLLAALFATFSWALNFVSPYLTQSYNAYDFICTRFIFSGLIGLLFLVRYRERLCTLGLGDVLCAFTLGFIGYAGYVACIMGGVIFAGPVITPAFLGLVPMLLVILGNHTRKTLAWRKLFFPLSLATGGLLISNVDVFFGAQHLAGRSTTLGVICSIGAVAAWVIFSFFNQGALEKRADMHAGVWTGLMMIGAAVGVLVFIPFGLTFDLFNFPTLGFSWSSAGHLYLWALGLANVASVGGAWAWNVASKHLPMVLTGQLISVETVFATAFGLIAEQRLPTPYEFAGVLSLVLGAVLAVRVVAGPSQTVHASVALNS
jgi:drug/metabolite transporter (DMT)-like permease